MPGIIAKGSDEEVCTLSGKEAGEKLRMTTSDPDLKGRENHMVA